MTSPIREFHAYKTTCGGSWERPQGDEAGWRTFDATAHRESGWLSIVTREHGTKTSKETMVTLDRDEAREFYCWLRDIFEGAS